MKYICPNNYNKATCKFPPSNGKWIRNTKWDMCWFKEMAYARTEEYIKNWRYLVEKKSNYRIVLFWIYFNA